MSNLVKRASAGLAKNIELSSRIKESVLIQDTVKDGLNDVEYRVAKSSLVKSKNGEVIPATKQISLLSLEELTNEVLQTVKFIARDIGIKNFEGEDARYYGTRFVTTLKDYYGDLTYREVEVAFELLSAHKLDDFLPRNGQGQPDRSHYQTFSSEFVGKVLNAFKAYKNQVWKKANGLKVSEEKTYSEEQKLELRQAFIMGICEQFDKYKEEGTKPSFPVSFLVVEELQRAGLIKDSIKITEKDRRLAVHKILNNNSFSKYDKSNIKNRFEEKKPDKTVDAYATIRAHERTIIQAFDSMIQSGIDIRVVLNS